MGACVEYLIDALACTWDLIKRIIVYCGIYISLFSCININRTINIRGHLVRVISVDTSKQVDPIQFMKLLVYYWSSKYLDKDFDTFNRLLKQHMKNIQYFSVTVSVDRILPSGNVKQIAIDNRVEINVSLLERTVDVMHRHHDYLDSSNSETCNADSPHSKNIICRHVIEDSYGFDLIDILDFAVGRSKCQLLSTKP